MRLLAVHAGSYPRIGDSRGQQKLRIARESFDHGGITGEKLIDVRNEMVREALAEQAKAGLDLVSDGQIGWDDAVSHLMGKLDGVRIGGLKRYFDTNTYFWQPQITGGLSAKGALLADDFKFARAISPRPVIATLTGPLTLSRLTLPGGACRTGDEIMRALVPILSGEVGMLASAGAGNIVVEEPFLCREPGALNQVEDALEILGGRKGPARLWLRISFGDAAPLYEKLQKLPVDGLILDFTCSAKLADMVASSGSDLPLGLGLVDARNTRLERPAKLAKEVERLMKRIHGAETWLISSNGVEYLPRTRASEKLAVLSKTRDLITGKGGKKPAARKGRQAGKPKMRKPGRMKKAKKPARPARRRKVRKASTQVRHRKARPPVRRKSRRAR